jgi:hypothetical protein
MSRSKARPRRSPKLRLEALEDRAVPAVGQLLVEAFHDLNENGVWDSGEGAGG